MGLTRPTARGLALKLVVLFIFATCLPFWLWSTYRGHPGVGPTGTTSTPLLRADQSVPANTLLAPAGRAQPTVVLQPVDPIPDKLVSYACPENQGAGGSGCQIYCEGNGQCSRARETCAWLVWCTHLVLASNGGPASLMHLPHGMAPDHSLAQLQLTEGGLTMEQRKRVYLVVAAGKRARQALGHFLARLVGTKLVQRVYHVMDPDPPDTLYFKNGGITRALATSEIDRVRVVFVYDDPVSVLSADYGKAFCEALGGSCSQLPKTLSGLAQGGSDVLRLNALYAAYLSTDRARSFPVVAINAAKMWDNTDAVVRALGLPPSTAGDLADLRGQYQQPHTSGQVKKPAVTPGDAQLLRELYAPSYHFVRSRPAVAVV